MMRRSLGLMLAVSVSVGGLAACGSEVTDETTSGAAGSATGGSGATGGEPAGGSEAGGAGGSGGGVDGPISLEAASAPDELTVELEMQGLSGGSPPTDAAAYQVTSDAGALTVTEVDVEEAAGIVRLTTEKQKLGIEYAITIDDAGSSLDGQSASFMSADTARFWASDFSSPVFAEYELVADRIAVGEHAVVYVEQGMSAFGVDTAVADFDDNVYPTETALLTEPPDQDGNGKIVLLGLDGEDYYGGYFSPINTLPNEQTLNTWGVHSNEMEMVYLNVASGEFPYEHVLPHEFSHLLYNQQHGVFSEDWGYHNEGLAECAVHAVRGNNAYATQYFLLDPTGNIAEGLSLVHWEWGNYDQYAYAYLMWSYMASQMDGVDSFGELFKTDGNPASIEAVLQAELGRSFDEVLRDAMVAMRVQAPTGPYGFGSMVSFMGGQPVYSNAGTLDLAPFGAGYLWVGPSIVDYPGDQGPNIRYVGFDANGDPDFTAPFDAMSGVLLAYNASTDANAAAQESTGPLAMPSIESAAAKVLGTRDPAWRHPPPVTPARYDVLDAWRKRTAPKSP